MKQTFNDFSIHKHRSFELFRSVDKKLTSTYFTNKETEFSYFDVIVFDYEYGLRKIYIKYPNIDYFVEMYDGGESSNGNMQNLSFQNIWKDSYYEKNIEIFKHDKNMMLKISDNFNFLECISTNYNVLANEKYLMLPSDTFTTTDCYKSKDEIPTYYFVNHPTYYFSYNTHKFYSVKNNVIKQYEITNFERYIDGGTTIIKLLDGGNNEHEFYSPTSFNKKLIPLFDDLELIETTIEEKLHIENLIINNILKNK